MLFGRALTPDDFKNVDALIAGSNASRDFGTIRMNEAQVGIPPQGEATPSHNAKPAMPPVGTPLGMPSTQTTLVCVSSSSCARAHDFDLAPPQPL